MSRVAFDLWAKWPWQRCSAVLERKDSRFNPPYFGRCDLKKNHTGAHALERGFDVVWFRTTIVYPKGGGNGDET